MYWLDVHPDFAQVAIWENGTVRHAGQVEICGEVLRVFADGLGPEDEVAIEGRCNTHAIVRALEPVLRVAVSNPMKTRAVAERRSRQQRRAAAGACARSAARTSRCDPAACRSPPARGR
jgi:hypothetical protein